MLMLLRHSTREALPVREPLNGRSFESARSRDKIGHDLGSGGHIDLDHRNGMEMRPTAQQRLRHALNRPGTLVSCPVAPLGALWPRTTGTNSPAFGELTPGYMTLRCAPLAHNGRSHAVAHIKLPQKRRDVVLHGLLTQV